MRDRVIFHIDINHCYAQIEEMKHPEFRSIPMAVGGHAEKRQGIILAKNDLAKKAGVQTGESLVEARARCAKLLILPPSYEDYIYYTGQVKDIYRRYSDQVESFGLDEAWIDFTDSRKLFVDPIRCAARIQQEVFEEIGLTVSVGISWNKAFAKLGSDLKKPSGFTVITKENYKDLVWPLPCEDLLYVGPATKRKLYARGLYTIGAVAQYPLTDLKHALGVAGETIWAFANGMDASPVCGPIQGVKSVGNSMTLFHDVHSIQELRPAMYVLAESVASRMKENGVAGRTVTVSIRSSGMDWFMKQCTLCARTDVSSDLVLAAMDLIEKNYDFHIPIRAAGLSVSGLAGWCSKRQLSLFEGDEDHKKERQVDAVMDQIREKYGFYSVRRACTMLDRALYEFDPKDDHTVRPVGYFSGRKMRGAHGDL